MVTIWSNVAKRELQRAFEYIKKDSPQNASKVIDENIKLTISLQLKLEIHRLDRYKTNNDGSYRAFELHRYRISYRILPDTIRIVRMRPTSRSPLIY
jgi:plasmid stabilization system protein ParE